MGIETLSVQAGTGPAFWFWAVLALGFLAVELATTTFALLLVAAVGAGLAAAVAYFFPGSLPWQIVTFSIGAIAAVLVGKRRAQYHKAESLDVVGATGQLVTVEEVDAQGRVRFVRWRDSTWSAHSDGGTAFQSGEQAKIVSVSGNVVNITRH